MILLSDLIDVDFQKEYKNEKLISLRKLKKLVIDETKSQISNQSEYFCYVRESLYNMLEKAAEKLPGGYQFLIKEGFRPAFVQNRSFNYIFNDYKEKYPEKSEKEIYKIVSQIVAPLSVAGHPTGAAIDITLLCNGKEAFMGTDYNDEPEDTDNKTFLDSDKITEEEKHLRTILSDVLLEVGFINYPPEWWHWSYGDKYWAFLKKETVKYSIIEDSEIEDVIGI